MRIIFLLIVFCFPSWAFADDPHGGRIPPAPAPAPTASDTQTSLAQGVYNLQTFNGLIYDIDA